MKKNLPLSVYAKLHRPGVLADPLELLVDPLEEEWDVPNLSSVKKRHQKRREERR